MIVGYASGAFDMFHVGHLNLIRNAKLLCDHLVVGVITDEFFAEIRGASPVVPFDERLAIVRNVSLVDCAIGDPFPDKREMWELIRFDLIVKGDDWLRKPGAERLLGRLGEVGVEVRFVPYTEHTSSSRLRELVRRLEKDAIERGD